HQGRRSDPRLHGRLHRAWQEGRPAGRRARGAHAAAAAAGPAARAPGLSAAPRAARAPRLTDRLDGLFSGALHLPRMASAPRLAPAARTQQERRDATRGRILDAAVESLIASGVAGTTTLEVQKRAGLSRGALLHHFPSKAQLMAATIEHLAGLRGRELKAAAAALPRGKARTARVFDLAWQSFTGPLFYVAMELRTAARTDAALL